MTAENLLVNTNLSSKRIRIYFMLIKGCPCKVMRNQVMIILQLFVQVIVHVSNQLERGVLWCLVLWPPLSIWTVIVVIVSNHLVRPANDWFLQLSKKHILPNRRRTPEEHVESSSVLVTNHSPIVQVAHPVILVAPIPHCVYISLPQPLVTAPYRLIYIRYSCPFLSYHAARLYPFVIVLNQCR